ncbi:hypothetical protein [Capnocytophaga canis]|uniref:hypothetical protein n=1 Tax=Capnocytophaga canis TaxID=1848903 RepID=UPI0037D414B6
MITLQNESSSNVIADEFKHKDVVITLQHESSSNKIDYSLIAYGVVITLQMLCIHEFL